MANCLGYEEIIAGRIAAGVDTAIAVDKTRCAVFYLDPSSLVPVRYRPDGTDPTAYSGIPIQPGQSITIAGYGTIKKSKFISTGLEAASVHALYYDQVDVVDMGLRSDFVVRRASDESVVVLKNLLAELQRAREDFSQEMKL